MRSLCVGVALGDMGAARRALGSGEGWTRGEEGNVDEASEGESLRAYLPRVQLVLVSVTYSCDIGLGTLG